MINKYSRAQEDASLLMCGLMALDALVQIALAFCMLFIGVVRLASALVTLALAVFSFCLWALSWWSRGFEQVEKDLREYQSGVRRWR